MEHIYTIKVKKHFDPRGLYPSERRYSASTVSGLAWVYLSLAAFAFLLTCLAVINPDPSALMAEERNLHFQRKFIFNEIKKQKELLAEERRNATILDDGDENITENNTDPDYTDQSQDEEDAMKISGTESYLRYPITLIVASSVLCIGGLTAGFTAILASRQWYVDHNITLFLLSAIFAFILSIISFAMIITWIVLAHEHGLTFCEFFSKENLYQKVHVVEKNVDDDFVKNLGEDFTNSLNNKTLFFIIKSPVNELQNKNIPLLDNESKENRTRKVLSINILIASIIGILWSFVSLQVAWKGMRADYPEDESVENRRGGTVQVVTEIKGNNTKHLPKNTKILPPQPDLIEHYPKDNKIKKFFQLQKENGGFFLKANQHENGFLVLGADDIKISEFPRRENSAEYKERIFNFLNRCSAEQSEIQKGVEQENQPEPVSSNPTGVTGDYNADRSYGSVTVESPNKITTDRVSLASWGDNHDYPIYDQNTLDFNKIMLNFNKKNSQDANKDEINKDELEAAETPLTDSEENKH